MRIKKQLFQSKTVEDNDILSYHFKEQCKIQRRINATMPHLKSLHDQPSVRVKANGAIVLNRYHNTSIPSDWVPAIVSGINDDDDDDENDDDDNVYAKYELNNSNSEHSILSNNSTVSSSQSFLSATPLRKRVSINAMDSKLELADKNYPLLPGISRSSSLPMFPPLSPPPPSSFTSSLSSSDNYHFPYEKKLDILLEEMEDVQQEGARMKKNYLLLEQRNKLLEKELDQRDQLIHSLQAQIQSLV